MISPVEIARRQWNLSTDRIRTLPVVVLMPHSRCNCRCVMCDIWKANRNGHEISSEKLDGHLAAFDNFNVQWFVLSGGEALMHSNLWTLCAKLRQLDARITILSTGILLKKWVDHVLRWTDGVTVSLDGSPEVHNDIRRIPRAFEKLQNGVRALKEEQPDFRITARSVVQRRNYFNLPNIVDSAKDMGLDEISFLAADVTSTAFNRPGGWDTERALDIAMSPPEVATFHTVVERMIRTHRGDFQSGFISETPEEMRRIVQHFRALNGQADFPTSRCNAPWVSTVIEADGTVRPCFFHDELGNIHDDSLADILNSEEAVNFRRNLDVSTNPTCERCTCTLKMSAFSSV